MIYDRISGKWLYSTCMITAPSQAMLFEMSGHCVRYAYPTAIKGMRRVEFLATSGINQGRKPLYKVTARPKVN